MLTFEFEKLAKEQGFLSICGIDEAGRGPLAGDVYAAAVILPDDCEIEGLNDSKKLSPARRNLLYDRIVDAAAAYAVGTATVREIEELNILQATFLAMKRAVEGLDPPADFALVDGNQTPRGIGIPSMTLVKGDGRSPSIAAASILAKVCRDRYMEEMDKLYPEYNFAKHKGYGTEEHIELIKKWGPSPIHRVGFLKNLYKG